MMEWWKVLGQKQRQLADFVGPGTYAGIVLLEAGTSCGVMFQQGSSPGEEQLLSFHSS